jgi:hypothetical protein
MEGATNGIEVVVHPGVVLVAVATGGQRQSRQRCALSASTNVARLLSRYLR